MSGVWHVTRNQWVFPVSFVLLLAEPGRLSCGSNSAPAVPPS